jgi:hypothetical protein
MLAKITKYIKTAIFDPVADLIAGVTTLTSSSDDIDGKNAVNTASAVFGREDVNTVSPIAAKTLTDATDDITGEKALITASTIFAMDDDTDVHPIVATRLTNSSDDIDGQNALTTASAVFGRKDVNTVSPIAAETLTSASDDIDQENALVTASAVFGRVDANTVSPIGATTDQYLHISDMSTGLAIAKGDVTGHSEMHKFGKAPDYDQADGFVTVWGGADDGQLWENMVYDYSATANIQYISSDNAGDTFDLEVQGLSTTYALTTQTKALNGTTRVTLDTPLRRVFRMKNVGSADNLGHIFCGIGTVSGGTPGVPDVATENRAIIHPGDNQTLMALYTIPSGKTGYMTDFYISTHGASRSATYTLKLLARPLGEVFQLKHTAAVSDTGTSHWTHEHFVPESFAAGTDIEIQCDVIGTAVTGAAISAGFDLVLVDD